jgi:hypothetical protein
MNWNYGASMQCQNEFSRRKETKLILDKFTIEHNINVINERIRTCDDKEVSDYLFHQRRSLSNDIKNIEREIEYNDIKIQKTSPWNVKFIDSKIPENKFNG